MSTEQEILERRLTYTSLLVDVSTSAIKVADVDCFLDETLQRIGTTVNVSRVYLFELTGQGHWCNTHEWVHEGTSSQREQLRDVSPEEGGWMMQEILQGHTVCFQNIRDMPDVISREILAMQGITSILATPLLDEGRVVGMFGFDQCDTHVEWPSEALDLILSVAHILMVVRNNFVMRQRIERQRMQLNDILDAITEKIYIADMDTHAVLFANQSIRDVFGEDIIGKKCYKVFQNLETSCSYCTNELIKTRDTPYAWTHYSAVMERTVRVIDRRIRLVDGRIAKFSFNIDVTDLLAAQQEKAQAEEESRAKGEFLARMSHEIRTPMNAVIGFTHLLARTQLDAQQRDYVVKAQQGATSLLHVINDILDFSKISAGKLTVDVMPFVLSEVLCTVHSLVGFAAQEKGLTLDVHVDENVPHNLCGDAARINQVLINLMSNAVKFTAQGSIALHIGVESHTSTSVTLRFEVCDTGIGITPEQQQRLFLPFSQADGSVTRRYGGSGLGLAISKYLVEMMGGTIGVHSAIGQGAQFFFTVQVEKTDAAQDLQLSESPAAESAASLQRQLEQIKGARVLVVDDNDINLEIAKELLESAGMIVAEAESGAQAIEMVANSAFALIFMDMQMPEMDGLETTRRIRLLEQARPESRILPIIAMTANAMIADRDRCLAAGMDSYIAKPLDPDQLMGQLVEWISVQA